MIQNRVIGRMLAWFLAFSLFFSMTFVSSAESDIWDIDMSSWDAQDAQLGDGVDIIDSDIIGTHSGDELVSGNDIRVEGISFWVTDGRGSEFGSYKDWNELLTAFKTLGNKAAEYTVAVAENGIIGTTMPSQAAKLTLKPAEDGGVLTFSGSTINMATALTIESAMLSVNGSANPVNINTKGKTLTLRDTRNLGAVKGSSSGSLVLEGDIEVQGVLQTFKNVTVQGNLRLRNNMTAITNLNLENGNVYPASGKNFTITNVTAGEHGTIFYPGEGALPVVKINGTVSGVLNLRQYVEADGVVSERYFTAGTKLLTASKARAEQFAVFGEKQVCYKKSSAIYVGAEILQLYAENELLGVYAQWSDAVAQINSRKQKSMSYRVVLSDDFAVTGALTMPGKGKYAGLTIESGAEGQQVQLKATGNATLTANMNLGANVSLSVGTVSGASWQLALAENTGLTATGAVTVGTLVMGEGASLQAGGNFTVKKTLEADEHVTLVLTQKKKAAVKDTVVKNNGKIAVKIRDKNDNIVTLTQGTTLFTVSGSSYATQYQLLDNEERELNLYRKGNALKVQGTLVTPITLYHVAESGEISLGEYATLADAKTEIARRKDARASYRLDVREEIFVKGAVPLPGAGTYKDITFTGQRIRTTGNLKLTGNVIFENVIRKVKNDRNDDALVITANISKYTLAIRAEGSIDNLGSVTGSAGSCLELTTGTEEKLSGNLSVTKLVLGSVLQVTGNVVVTEICPEQGNMLTYDLAKSVTIKGDITGDGTKLVLNPLKGGQAQAYVDGQKILNSAPKANVSRLQMAQATDYALYRDGNAVKLGSPMVTVFENTLDYESCITATTEGQSRFVRINDAIDYINDAPSMDFVLRLEKDVPSAGAFTMPAKGKHLVLCGAGEERRTLALTGSVTLDGSSLEVRNVKLDNKTSAGPGVILKNGASLWLYETGINTLSAPAGTAVTLEGRVDIGGAVTGACDLTVLENAVIRGNGSMTVQMLTLKAASETESYGEFRLLTGKTITVNGEVKTGEKGYFVVSQVDKTDALASIKEGTVMVTAEQGSAEQFRTENIIPGNFVKWSLVKEGAEIKTAEATEGEGEWSGDYL
ncbi:MAG: hypothetical protein K2H41_04895 [Acetatifactor sp.]|nr:hypothetical protein [Acetatifactor sp.]